MITPADVSAVRFSKPPFGKRGYNEDEVDIFLEGVHATLQELYRRLEQYESAGDA